ncbi:hypothetical protein VOLCADRAFT_93052 [Volvox carteri f. nagariensis]|uniref:Uncharacterized protein n=1 Tax=Volvox carteri f. nagariensis TaxID=3068 RepID=D8U179_VOLCA|nr:uncharacterized protein VOLCADRAFT_93052 [Volvox carteri f. nagariensis]EFJ46587.1 hypothetical protein VOLCADRAFT_93052 [Volvox carteri f. nagariensis]|eukprot:XP_002952444.1 hypothetical protein VOLCADRAFT_93052 [Volvox carteri f. nagariensis]
MALLAHLSFGQHPALTVCAASSCDKPSTASTRPHIAAALITGTYAIIFGIALVLAPKTVFGLLFKSETVSSGWIRVGGILFTLIGWQYLGTARADSKGQGARGFYCATVWSRLALSAAFVMLVATGQSPAGLLVLAGINTLGAASMHLALSRSVAAKDNEPEKGSSRSCAS